MPWKRIKGGCWDLLLGAASLLVTVGLSIYTMVRCRDQWQFVTIAMWKLCLSMMLGITSIIVALREGDMDDEPHEWLWLYLVGSLLGIVGLLSLGHCTRCK